MDAVGQNQLGVKNIGSTKFKFYQPMEITALCFWKVALLDANFLQRVDLTHFNKILTIIFQ